MEKSIVMESKNHQENPLNPYSVEAQSWFPDELYAEIGALHQEGAAIKGCQAPEWAQWNTQLVRKQPGTIPGCEPTAAATVMSRAPWGVSQGKVGRSLQCQQDAAIPAAQNSSMPPFCCHSRKIYSRSSQCCLQASKGFIWLLVYAGLQVLAKMIRQIHAAACNFLSATSAMYFYPDKPWLVTARLRSKSCFSLGTACLALGSLCSLCSSSGTELVLEQKCQYKMVLVW